MTVDFDAVFGNKATASYNGPHPAAGKPPPLSACPDRARLQTKNSAFQAAVQAFAVQLTLPFSAAKQAPLAF